MRSRMNAFILIFEKFIMTIQLPLFEMMLGLAIMFSKAFAEGANYISKVVATLVGSDIANYKKKRFSLVLYVRLLMRYWLLCLQKRWL